MPDIFVSYARDDRAQARRLADALALQGWDTWWDRRIPPGQDFATFIERQLASAACVVVLWSKSSISSEYVRDEASEAKERNALVPALIDHVKPPLGFRQRQVADLSDWNGDVRDPEFISLVDAIRALVARGVEPTHQTESTAALQKGTPRGVTDQRERLADAEALTSGDIPRAPEVAGEQIGRQFSRRYYIAAGGAAVVALAGTGIWHWAGSSDPEPESYNALTVTVKFGLNAGPEQVLAVYGTSAFYDTLKPTVVIGRFFSSDERSSHPKDSPNVVLLNELFWRQRFNSDPSVVSYNMTLNDYYFQIVGVVSLPDRWHTIELLFPEKPDQRPVI